MTRINSVSKGKNFEREISNLLTQTLEPLNFQRVLGSGAFMGGLNSHRSNNFSEEKADSFIGDVYCTNYNDFRFTLEAKSYKEQVKLSDFFSENFIVFKWFRECEFDCKKNNKEPLLIFKFNRTKIFYCMKEDYKIHDENVIKYKGLVIGLFSDLLNEPNEYWRKN